ncbi:hypothetical protein K737_300753 [Holospora undulata HU1]|uniref:Uncharacterized protein n=2 Tax=Holospora TaxID=44747 RepID=A0A061JG63_9PROT|nr:hypothetical protein K737_300753 [Holospora undulata HU1]GAJ46362.1 hypothetical protein HE1_00694 [Holospora elegans E1]
MKYTMGQEREVLRFDSLALYYFFLHLLPIDFLICV